MANANSAPMPVGGQSSRFAMVDLTLSADRRLTPTDQQVYSILAAHRNAKSGKAWPKRATIARLANVHPETVTKATRRLVEYGYLVKSEGRGRGCTVVYTFPLIDQRQAQRQAAQAQAKPEHEARKPRKPQAEKTSRPAGFCAAHSSIGRTDVLEKDPTTLPFPPTQTQVEPETATGFAVVGAAEDISQEVVPAESNGHTATISPEVVPTSRLVYPKAFSGQTNAVMVRMMRLAGVPAQEQQALLDELAWNARDHGVKRPVGYLRALLTLRSQGRLTLEVAHLEADRRRQIEANQRALQIVEQRHLAALERGTIPLPAYKPPITSLAEATQKAKQAPRCVLFDERERERLRLEYLQAQGMGPRPAPATPPPRGEGYTEYLRQKAAILGRINGTSTD